MPEIIIHFTLQVSPFSNSDYILQKG